MLLLHHLSLAMPLLVCACQVHIEFTEGEDKITLEGPTEDVTVAQEQIESMVKDLVSAPSVCTWLGQEALANGNVRPRMGHRDQRAS